MEQKIQDLEQNKHKILNKINYALHESSSSRSRSPSLKKNNRHSNNPLLKKNKSDQTSSSPLENLYQGEINLMKKYKEELSDMKELYREVLQNIQPVDYDKEDIRMIEEKIMKEQEMFEISEVNSIKEDSLKEPKVD